MMIILIRLSIFNERSKWLTSHRSVGSVSFGGRKKGVEPGLLRW
jgi:hypothetical protein